MGGRYGVEGGLRLSPYFTHAQRPFPPGRSPWLLTTPSRASNPHSRGWRRQRRPWKVVVRLRCVGDRTWMRTLHPEDGDVSAPPVTSLKDIARDRLAAVSRGRLSWCHQPQWTSHQPDASLPACALAAAIGCRPIATTPARHGASRLRCTRCQVRSPPHLNCTSTFHDLRRP